MQESLNDISFLILIIGGCLFLAGIIALLTSLFLKEGKETATTGLKLILWGALLFIGGFTLCSLTFSLGRIN